MGTRAVNVGLIGCGMISKIYLENARRLPILNVVACADLVPARASARAAEFELPRVLTVEQLLGDSDIELVLDLTIPTAHGPVAFAAIQNGKSVYNEKPLAVDRASGKRLQEAARERSLRIGCAPDTFLGGGLQSCRKLIDDGAIGEPVAAAAFMLSHGHESWHADPDFFYQPGAGPLFDMGPYYLTALISLLGPARRVTGSAQITFPERVITSEPRRGTTITVNTPTHVAGVLDFASGAVGTIVTTFDVWSTDLPRIEIYGTDGSLSVPDPNTFGGPILLRKPRTKDWVDLPLTHGWTDNSRGIGLADLAQGIRLERPHRANGDLAYHVLDVMESILNSSRIGRHRTIESTCERPEPISPGADGCGFGSA